MIIFVLVGLVLGATAVIFAFQNTMDITVTFLFWELNASLAVVVVLSIVAGMVISFLVSIPEIVDDYIKFKTVVKEKHRLEGEIALYQKKVNDLNEQMAIHATKNENVPLY